MVLKVSLSLINKNNLFSSALKKRLWLHVFMCLMCSKLAAQAVTHKIQDQRLDLSAKDVQKVRSVTRPTTNFFRSEKFESMSGGAATSKKLVNQDAFSQPSANLTFEAEQNFRLGNALFRKIWVSSPSSTQASDGLGPLFNARSCQSCHIKDGRGHPPEGDPDATSMFFRLAQSPKTQQKKLTKLNFPDPIYGEQLQDFAVPGLNAEGQIMISYTTKTLQFADGASVSLRQPSYAVKNLAYGAIHPDTTLSPRIANPMIGLGLLEAIHPADIKALADPDDDNADGISGRMARLFDQKTGHVALSRFGWKAQNSSIRAQTVAAFSGDIGISTPDLKQHFGDCTPQQQACFLFQTGVQSHLGDAEASELIVTLVTFYAQNLAVPIRRNVSDSEVLRGKALFYKAGCVSCHTPKFVTRRDAQHAAQSFQLIWPYTDLLLHDMGEGLSDGQAVGVASGNEWRTPPLWGIGLTKRVSGHTFFLHDGRARNLTEAIMWHGGEAALSKDNFSNLSKVDRAAVIRFLESL